MDKGAALNQRVWTLFERAGFQTQPNSNSTAEHVVTLPLDKQRPLDLFAQVPDLGVTIAGSNKSGAIKGWSAHVNDLEAISKAAGANKALLVVTGFEVEDADRLFALHRGVVIWQESELAYYEAVTDAIGEYAKYEIIHNLGITTTEEKDTHKVLAIRLSQPMPNSGTELFMFSMTPERLLKTCVVFRRAKGSADAYQRMLRKDRLPKIRSFVTKADAILPTNLVLHLGSNVVVEPLKKQVYQDLDGNIVTISSSSNDLVVLSIPMEYASLELIDGQHRLFGFAKTDAATKKSFSLLVLGLRNLSDKTRQNTFVAINDNSRRMDPNLVSFLKYTKDEAACQKDTELMAIRIVVDLNRMSPFKGLIRLLDIGKQKLTLKGMSGYDLRGLLGASGALRKLYPSNKPEVFTKVIRLYFSTIRSMFKSEWDHPETYIIATNRGVSAFLKLFKSILLTHKKKITTATIKKYVGPLKSWRWDYATLSSSYVGSQGWKEFYRDLAKDIKKQHKDFVEIP
jgi:DNA sulfur modification protein DndB